MTLLVTGQGSLVGNGVLVWAGAQQKSHVSYDQVRAHELKVNFMGKREFLKAHNVRDLGFIGPG